MIGVDICSTARCFKLFNKYGDRFLKKFLHQEEIIKFQSCTHILQKQQYLASRWAAKEATFKALSSVSNKILSLPFPDIRVSNSKNGSPIIELDKPQEDKLKELGIKQIHISLSHEVNLTIAFVLLQL